MIRSAFFVFTAHAQLQYYTADPIECRRDCIDLARTFCRLPSATENGVCCAEDNPECMADNINPYVCSNAIQYSQMYTSVCPYQSDVCGHSSPVIEHSTGGALQNMQSRYGFFTDFTCSFEIKDLRNTIDPGQLKKLVKMILKK